LPNAIYIFRYIDIHSSKTAGAIRSKIKEFPISNDQINTPAQYQHAWDNYLAADVSDISSKLFATIHFPEDGLPIGQNYLYPKGFYYAWGFSNSNLALFLELNHRYGKSDPTKVSVGLAEFAGFTGVESFEGANLAVYSLRAIDEEQSEVLVPTVQTWMRVLDSLGCSVPMTVITALTKEYANLGRDQDAVDIYNQLSGLERNVLLNPSLGYAPVDPSQEEAWQAFNISTSQQQAYKHVMQKLGRSAYSIPTSSAVNEVGAVTLELFSKLSRLLDTMDPETETWSMAMAVRAALAQGQDASALNTTEGVGYNTYPNPFVCKPRAAQTIQERYTGREFILLNRRLDDCYQYCSFELQADSTDRPYLINGWC
jgi:hypothetical protein